MKNPVGSRHGGTEIVAIKKPARQIQKMIIVEAFLTVEEFAQVNDIHHIGPGQTAGIGHFCFTVGTVSGDDDGFDYF